MYDLGLDPITLILKLDLDMIQMYHHTENEVSRLNASKVIPEQIHTQTHTHRQTDKQTDTHTNTHRPKNITYPRTREGNMCKICVQCVAFLFS